MNLPNFCLFFPIFPDFFPLFPIFPLYFLSFGNFFAVKRGTHLSDHECKKLCTVNKSTICKKKEKRQIMFSFDDPTDSVFRGLYRGSQKHKGMCVC